MDAMQKQQPQKSPENEGRWRQVVVSMLIQQVERWEIRNRR